MQISITKTKTPKVKPDQNSLGFGKYFTDHMFQLEYTEGQGWHDAQILPFGDFSISPAALVFHYAQESFEGLKAYRTSDNRILLFRPEMNARRMAVSNKRLCMPSLSEEDFIEAITKLVNTDRDWVPSALGTSLYIRPFIFATEEAVGVHVSKKYKFCIILSPVGAYYPTGLNPVKIFVEDEFVRAVRGGTGFTKAGGNYAMSLAGQEKAQQKGYAQVLWLDGVERKYIEEVGTSNVFFKINGEVLTAPLDGSILPGVTRDSVLTLLRKWGLKVSERRFSIDEVLAAYDNGLLEEVFGAGTAAVISPVGELNYKGKIMIINNSQIGSLTNKLYNYLTDLQWGRIADDFNWTRII